MVCKSSIGCSRSWRQSPSPVAGAKAFDDANYPELAGGWFGMVAATMIRRSLAAFDSRLP